MADGEKEMDLVSSRFANVITTREPADDDDDVNSDLDLNLHLDFHRSHNPNQDSDQNPDKDIRLSSSTRDQDRDPDEDQDCYLLPPISRNLFFCNCPEKVTFVLDITKEPGSTPYQLRNRQTYSANYMVKQALQIFVNVKSTIDKRHQFAVVVVNGNDMQQLVNFGSDLDDIQEQLNFLDNDDCLDVSFEELFQPSKVFRYLAEQIRRDRPSVDSSVPSFVHRVVFIYARSFCKPLLEPQFLRFYREELASEPTFFLDVLYVHENADDKNMCDEIYRILGELDIQGQSYILEAGRTPAHLYAAFAKLVGHPLLRPSQDRACYKVTVPEV